MAKKEVVKKVARGKDGAWTVSFMKKAVERTVDAEATTPPVKKSTVTGTVVVGEKPYRLPVRRPNMDVNEFDKLLGVPPSPEKFATPRQSSITGCEDCPRAGLLRTCYGIRSVKRFPGFDQSTYVHATLAMLLRGASRDHIERVIDAFMLDVAADCHQPCEADRAQDACMGYAVGVFLHKKLMQYVTSKGWKIQNVEERFFVPLVLFDPTTQQTHQVSVRLQLDFVIVDPKTNNVYIWDTKAVATSPSKYIDGQVLGLQSAMYMMACRHPQVFGSHLKGFILGIVSKPTCDRKGLTRGTEQSLDDYVVEVEENLEGRGRWEKLATKRDTDKPVEVCLHVPSEDDIYDAVSRLQRFQQRQLEGRNRVAFHKHNSCVSGNIMCEFVPLCLSDAGMWAGMINEPGGKYTTRPDPLDSEYLHGSVLVPKDSSRIPVKPKIMVGTRDTPDMVKKVNRSRMSPAWAPTKW